MSAPLVAVVDDDPRIRALLACELEDLGAEVLLCREGSELLNADRLGDVALVLLDWMMPGLDGAATLQALQHREHQARVVVVSALCDPQLERDALGWGAAAILLKTDAIAQLPGLLKPG
ncbi:response regulator transcription factor [Vulcanococcus sp.]|uniref:response regulator transcription factor n=1 Tax=Vulcanococcus sp. TaxID=2856995 RepID=UPI003C0EC648